MPDIPPRGDGEYGPGDTRARVTVRVYPDYTSAQRAVDFLSDNRFPVERSAIVGTGLRLVEKVLGRLTVGRAALLGAGTGAWIGLLIGLLLGIFAVDAWWRVLLIALVMGAAWGAVLGAIAHALTGGARDFKSMRSLEAGEYAVIVDVEYADQASELLNRLG